MTALPFSYDEVAQTAMTLTDAQRAELANRLVLSVTDPHCLPQMARIEGNAARMVLELNRHPANHGVRA